MIKDVIIHRQRPVKYCLGRIIVGWCMRVKDLAKFEAKYDTSYEDSELQARGLFIRKFLCIRSQSLRSMNMLLDTTNLAKGCCKSPTLQIRWDGAGISWRKAAGWRGLSCQL
jgi:hypothetical protein